MPDSPKSSPIVKFDAALAKKDLAKVRDNLSAIVLRDEHLWLGGDEGTSIHRMTREASGNFGGHTIFDLHDTLELPAAAKEEIDIEGLDVDGGYLWLIGSHSAKRKKAEADKSTGENLDRLATIEAEGNRYTLARVPLDESARPVPKHRGLMAARLKGDEKGNLLTKALRVDRHVGRFLPHVLQGESIGVPSKDNGFDVEGLAVAGNRVFLGLRGPVLRGWAIVIELRIGAASGDTLTLDSIGASGEPYLKHFLQLDGLGIRDLVIHENDLLVLAGPSMDLDGPVFIYRWKEALHETSDSLTWKSDLQKVVTVPFGITTDHAEGLSLASDSPLSVLVCYDSPDPETRIVGADHRGIRMDMFDIS